MNQPIEDFKRPNELKSAIPVSDWIQMEMNRSLYLDLEWFDSKNLEIVQHCLIELKNIFEEILYLFFQ